MNNKVLERSDSNRLSIVYTLLQPFLDVPPRYYFEKKLHFAVQKDEDQPLTFRDQRPSKSVSAVSGATAEENSICYTYISSCAQAPTLPPGKKTFS